MTNPLPRVINALTPNHDSQGAYVGQIRQRETVIVHLEDGTPVQTEIEFFISWESVKQMLEMVRKRAGV